MQALALTAEYAPAAHGSHVAPPLEYDPAVHAWQAPVAKPSCLWKGYQWLPYEALT